MIGEPQFRNDAKLEVVKCWRTNNLTIRIPLADGNPDSRVYAYEVGVAVDAGGSKLVETETDAMNGVPPKLFKAVYAAGCNMGIGHEPNGGVTTLEITGEELSKVHPSFNLTVAVRPLSSLGTSGAPIVAKVKW